MIKDIRHTGIVVQDLGESMHFYADILGFQLYRQMEESGDFIDRVLALPDVKVTTVKMSAPDGQMIELLKFHSHQCNETKRDIIHIGISHIAFTVDDLNRLYDRLKMKGVSFLSPPQLSPDGNAKVTFCRAPEGTYIELVEELK